MNNKAQNAETSQQVIGANELVAQCIEASRMQGMPEWASHHAMPTHVLKHAGNAVVVPLARELGRQLGAILAART